MNNIIGDRLRFLRERNDITQDGLADAANLNRVTIAKYEAGKIQPSSKSLKKLAIALGVSVDEIVSDNSYLKAATSMSTRIPVLGTIPAGVPLEAIEDIIDWEDIPLDWTRGDKGYFALQVRGNSMHPKYEEGDVIILRRQETCESGQDCAVIVDGNDATFKRVRISADGIVLQSINPDYESYVYTKKQVEELPVRIIGVVVELRRRI